MVAVGTAEGDVFKLISECHAIVGVALGADEGKTIVGTIPHQVLYHLGGERREGGERERGRREREEEEGGEERERREGGGGRRRERERERERERRRRERERKRRREERERGGNTFENKNSFWPRGTTEHYHYLSETASDCLTELTLSRPDLSLGRIGEGMGGPGAGPRHIPAQ